MSEVLRSVAWDGPPPAPGDQVVLLYRVVDVAAGPGPGQYRLEVDADAELDPDARLVWWTEHVPPGP